MSDGAETIDALRERLSSDDCVLVVFDDESERRQAGSVGHREEWTSDWPRGVPERRVDAIVAQPGHSTPLDLAGPPCDSSEAGAETNMAGQFI